MTRRFIIHPSGLQNLPITLIMASIQHASGKRAFLQSVYAGLSRAENNARNKLLRLPMGIADHGPEMAAEALLEVHPASASRQPARRLAEGCGTWLLLLVSTDPVTGLSVVGP